ncbi:MAG: FAD/FMN-containing dehydrogenase [Planctomycetota bacterium]
MSERAPRPWRRLRLVVLLAAAAGLWVIGRPVVFLAWTAWTDQRVEREVAAGSVDDVSGLEHARVQGVLAVPSGTDEAVEALRGLLDRARAEDLPVSIAGARHSMGGHTIARDGLVADMSGHAELAFDDESGRLTVGSGATWGEILRFLDPLGLSVGVMQSNDSFTVGGSISVNCHGWQHGQEPVASTVESLRLMLSDGRVLNCSRGEEPELFSLALGGYGLFGIILDVTLSVVSNQRYRQTATILPAAEFGPRFLARAADPTVGLAIGRLSVDPDSFLDEAIMRVLVHDDQPAALPPLEPSSNRKLRRTIFRGSIGSDYGKRLRWSLEKRFGAQAGGTSTRNAELAEPVHVYANGDPDRTELLFEAFVPHAALDGYRRTIQPLLKESPCDLLNLTIRDVRTDQTTFLRYADQDMFSLVMLFHLERTAEADEELQALTRQLIEAALDAGGRYYLPYRLHATTEQFDRAYPMAQEFFAAKRRYDPEERFQNRFYREYGAKK